MSIEVPFTALLLGITIPGSAAATFLLSLTLGPQDNSPFARG